MYIYIYMVKEKYLHQLTETLAPLYFSHVISVPYLEFSRISLRMFLVKLASMNVFLFHMITGRHYFP